jgi:hypothetical protein
VQQAGEAWLEDAPSLPLPRDVQVVQGDSETFRSDLEDGCWDHKDGREKTGTVMQVAGEREGELC